ncbi:MAG: hypothetical protein ACD_76C00164G0007 [uncultured bacterium]|nr:MAG: hypothetical protein ACD_76C00164G0007 [uncultured bacterium]HBD05501.1 hypothetical protein [Candidatus Uhrbacteria bacterium]
MRIFADENIARSVVIGLRKAGHDVLHALDNMSGATDEQIMATAQKEDRVILTHDHDFGNVLRFPLHEHAGVFILRYRLSEPEHVFAILSSQLSQISFEQINNHVAVFQETEVRIFPLN